MDQTPPAAPQTPNPPPTGVPAPVRIDLALTSLTLAILGIVPCLGIPLALTGLILGIVALISKTKDRGKAIAGIVISIFMLTVYPLVVGVPSLHRNPEMANRAICKINLRHIGGGMHRYANENRDALPLSLDALIEAEQILPTHLDCPSTETEGGDYFYLAPSPNAPAITLIACDFAGNHEGLRNILRFDGSASEMTDSQFDEELAKPHNAAFAEALRAAEENR